MREDSGCDKGLWRTIRALLRKSVPRESWAIAHPREALLASAETRVTNLCQQINTQKEPMNYWARTNSGERAVGEGSLGRQHPF